MRRTWIIAANTFRAALRDRILHGIAGFALLFILFTSFLGSISLGEDLVIIRSVGLGGMYIFALVITIFLGASLVYTEIERRTIYLLLSKPVSAGEVVRGKFLGLLMSVALVVALMAAAYLGVVAHAGGGFDAPALLAIAAMLCEIALFISFTMVFSTFLTPLGATIYAMIMLYVGHSLGLLLQLVRASGPFAKLFANAAYYLLPNLEKFNLRNDVLHSLSPSLLQSGLIVAYAACYTALLLYAATMMLEKKDL